MQGKVTNPRKLNLIIDMIHVVICIVIIIMAAITFWKPMENDKCYPFIFGLAAILNFINAAVSYRSSGRRKNIVSVIALILLGMIFLAVTVISAMSVWRF
jgi:uncharacterized membrane protein HdeD (DUF308 family)